MDIRKNLFIQRACAAWEQVAEGSCCLHPWLDRALVGQVPSWGEPRFPRRWKRWVHGSCTTSVPGIRWGQLQLNHGVREGTKTFTRSLTLSQLKSLAGLLSKLEQPQEHSWPQDFLGLRPPPALSRSRLDTSFPNIQKPEKVLCTTLPVRCYAT